MTCVPIDDKVNDPCGRRFPFRLTLRPPPDSFTSFSPDKQKHRTSVRTTPAETSAQDPTSINSPTAWMPRSYHHPSTSFSSPPLLKTDSSSSSAASAAIPLRTFRPEQATNSSSSSSPTTHPQRHSRVLFEATTASDYDLSDEEDDSGMGYSNRPGLVSRPSENGRSAEPLLNGGGERGRTSYEAERGVRPRSLSAGERERARYRLRSRSPVGMEAKMATRKKYALAAVFLVLSLVSFVIQTETAVYIQSTLGWRKAYLMLYMTHGSWILLWPTQLLILKFRKPHTPWSAFLRSHFQSLLTTCRMILHQTPHLSRAQSRTNPIPFMIRNVLFITFSLTIAGSTWYIAVNLTTPSDLTAIYNCSAFFAYVFSIFLLNDKWRRDKIFSVAIAILGVLIVAYGDTSTSSSPPEESSPTGPETPNRTLGNIIIGIGSVLYGFYEVLYKRLACPPAGVSSGRSVIFANTVGSLLGLITLTILWIPIPLLHWSGLEKFELPRGEAAWMMFISVMSNAVFSGSFLVLISLTSPVLSSVAALLTIFLVAVVDWMLTGVPVTGAGLVGGMVIVVAFGGMAAATYREMQEEAERRGKEDGEVEGSEDDEEEV